MLNKMREKRRDETKIEKTKHQKSIERNSKEKKNIRGTWDEKQQREHQTKEKKNV